MSEAHDEVMRHVASLNKYSFIAFVHEMNRRIGISPLPMAELGEGAFRREDAAGCHTVFLFHHVPLELFRTVHTLLDPELKRTLAHLSSLYEHDFFSQPDENRSSQWSDGPATRLRGLGFFTNMPRLPNQDPKLIVQQYEELASALSVTTRVGFADPNQIVEKRPSDAASVLRAILKTAVDGLAIDLSQDSLTVRHFSDERFIKSGALQKSVNPCEPVFVSPAADVHPLVSEFESLLQDEPKESALERFLTAHYRELFGFAYDRIETQLWLRFPELDISGKARRLDVFLRNSIERDWELVEVKRLAQLTSSYRDVPILSHEVHGAIAQLKNYRKILASDKVRDALARDGIEYYEPALRLVVGRRPSISHAQWRWLKESNLDQVKLITYDDLLEEMALRLRSRQL